MCVRSFSYYILEHMLLTHTLFLIHVKADYVKRYAGVMSLILCGDMEAYLNG